MVHLAYQANYGSVKHSPVEVPAQTWKGCLELDDCLPGQRALTTILRDTVRRTLSTSTHSAFSSLGVLGVPSEFLDFGTKCRLITQRVVQHQGEYLLITHHVFDLSARQLGASRVFIVFARVDRDHLRRE